MNGTKMLCICIAILLASISLGSAACTNCNYTIGNDITAGTKINLTGPADSGSQHRPLNYQWIAYNCSDGSIIDLNLISENQTMRDLGFYAPPEGNYSVSLTVTDKNFTATCRDTQKLCFNTTPPGCPELCCGEVCINDTPDYTQCPWNMTYDGLVVPDWDYYWILDDATWDHDDIDDQPIATNIDWTKQTIGPHTLEFEIYDDLGELVLSCNESCHCSPYTDLEEPCTIYVVEEPTASIGSVVG